MSTPPLYPTARKVDQGMKALLRGEREISLLKVLGLIAAACMFVGLGLLALSSYLRFQHLTHVLQDRCAQRLPYDTQSQAARQAMIDWFEAYRQTEMTNPFINDTVRRERVSATETAIGSFQKTLDTPPPSTCKDLAADLQRPELSQDPHGPVATVLEPTSVHQP